MRSKFRHKPDADARMFIRIRTAEGQIRRTEVDENDENILGQAFIRNEIVNDFAAPLSQAHGALRDDMIDKMSAIAREVNGRDKVDA